MKADINCIWSVVQKGVPTFLDAVLAEKFDIHNPMLPMNYAWDKPQVGIIIDFPEELWLICKERLLMFDYYPAFNGFIVSRAFLDILNECNTYNQYYQYVKLNTVSWKGKKITDKTYYYLIFNERENIIDHINSEYQIRKGANMELVHKNGFGIEKYASISFSKKAEKSFYQIYDSIFNRYLFCDDQVKQKMNEQKLYGFDFLEMDKLVETFNKRYR